MKDANARWKKEKGIVPQHVVITGASSGLGAALARAYAGPGVVLSLSGRNASRLNDIAAQCTQAGARVNTGVIDVRDADALADWLKRCDADRPVDLLIANAGISGGTGSGGTAETLGQVRNILETNLQGVVNTVSPLLEVMRSRKKGQIALMASLAGFKGFPGAPAYCASKAAVRVYGEALRAQMMGTGVQVSVICPGFVRSPMTDVNDFPMPFLMQADKAARIIQSGLQSNLGLIAFPFVMFMAVKLLSILPEWLSTRVVCATPSKSDLS